MQRLVTTAGIRLREGVLDPAELRCRLASLRHDAVVVGGVSRGQGSLSDADEPVTVALRVVTELDRLGIDYLVGGSIASSVHGTCEAP